ncbi:threonine synthase [Nostoc ellipsosporum NOK]|nr:threonine synthase [Nostoc ellipsosporum NOK]
MNYYSINRQSPVVSFREAAIKGQAPDKGLYFPETLPPVDKALVDNIDQYSNEEIAFRVIRPYVGDSIPEQELQRIVSETVNFPVPLVKVTEDIYSLELFHGPTLAFKDTGARFMSRCLGYFLRNETKKVTVLVATSGDTGGAVASGFYGVEGVEVVILYPSGKVSPVQEKQLTTLGKNISAIEVNGSFDDCQRLVKQAFADEELNRQLFLTSANSINVARWLPQQFYYFFAWKQWPYRDAPPVIAVPSGNFGNICAGILAARTGLPVKHFIAACNVNDIASHYLSTGELRPKEAVATLSNAMDVGHPSNFVRILELFGYDELKKLLSAATITDDETLQTIRSFYNKHGYLPDPHGAVGFLALQRYLDAHPGDRGWVAETAHPVKFPEAVESVTGQPVAWPDAVKELIGRSKKSIRMEPDYEALRSYLLKNS